jgi:hypothetical protein
VIIEFPVSPDALHRQISAELDKRGITAKDLRLEVHHTVVAMVKLCERQPNERDHSLVLPEHLSADEAKVIEASVQAILGTAERFWSAVAMGLLYMAFEVTMIAAEERQRAREA